MFNIGTSGTGWEGAPGLTTQAEPLPLKIPPQTIQEGDNTKESQKYQKNSSLGHLHICKVPQEAMEDQRQTLKRINQKALLDQTRCYDINLLDGIFPTRDHSPSHWGSNPR